jgi:hypothetical protein
MAPDKIALQDLNAEEEADALLREDDEREGGSSHHLRDSDDFKAGLEDLEESESLPPPVQATTAVSFANSCTGGVCRLTRVLFVGSNR